MDRLDSCMPGWQPVPFPQLPKTQEGHKCIHSKEFTFCLRTEHWSLFTSAADSQKSIAHQDRLQRWLQHCQCQAVGRCYKQWQHTWVLHWSDPLCSSVEWRVRGGVQKGRGGRKGEGWRNGGRGGEGKYNFSNLFQWTTITLQIKSPDAEWRVSVTWVYTRID